MMNILDAFKEIKDTAKNNNDSDRIIKEIKVGQVVRQGDLYIHAVDENHTRGEEIKDRKMAEGSSKGSSHYISIDSDVKIYKGTTKPKDYKYNLAELLGPFIESNSGFKLTHPEHSDVIFPAGSYQITYQLDTRTMAKVKD